LKSTKNKISNSNSDFKTTKMTSKNNPKTSLRITSHSTPSERQSSNNLNNARPITSNNDKSKSKNFPAKDLSPAKAKMSKSSKVLE